MTQTMVTWRRGMAVGAVLACLAIAWGVFQYVHVPTVPMPPRPITPTLPLALPDIRLDFPSYSVVVSHGDFRGQRFGISSLRLHDQEVDFCQPGLVLADWEWLRVQSAGGQERQYSMFDHRELPADERPWRRMR